MADYCALCNKKIGMIGSLSKIKRDNDVICGQCYERIKYVLAPFGEPVDSYGSPQLHFIYGHLDEATKYADKYNELLNKYEKEIRELKKKEDEKNREITILRQDIEKAKKEFEEDIRKINVEYGRDESGKKVKFNSDDYELQRDYKKAQKRGDYTVMENINKLWQSEEDAYQGTLSNYKSTYDENVNGTNMLLEHATEEKEFIKKQIFLLHTYGQCEAFSYKQLQVPSFSEIFDMMPYGYGHCENDYKAMTCIFVLTIGGLRDGPFSTVDEVEDLHKSGQDGEGRYPNLERPGDADLSAKIWHSYISVIQDAHIRLLEAEYGVLAISNSLEFQQYLLEMGSTSEKEFEKSLAIKEKDERGLQQNERIRANREIVFNERFDQFEAWVNDFIADQDEADEKVKQEAEERERKDARERELREAEQSVTTETERKADAGAKKKKADATVGILCPNCGNQNPSRAKFCKYCGASVVQERYCTECGNKLRPGKKFCSRCGTKVEED